MTDQAATARSAPGMATYAQLGAVVLFWSTNWPLMKAVLPHIGPFTFNALRISGSALLLLALMPMVSAPLLPRRGERAMLGLIGLLQIGGMLALSTWALQSVPPGRAAVLVYTMQIWALPLAFLIARERPSGQRIVGGLLAFAGVLVFFNPALVDWNDRSALMGNGLLLASAVCWAIAASLYRRRLWRTPFWTQIFWQITVSAVFVGPIALAVEGGQPITWTPVVIGGLIYNWLIATGFCYWLWSKALTVMPAAQAGQIVCLVPITALLQSAAIFGEPLTTGVLLSVALIAAGIVITARAK